MTALRTWPAASASYLRFASAWRSLEHQVVLAVGESHLDHPDYGGPAWQAGAARGEGWNGSDQRRGQGAATPNAAL